MIHQITRVFALPLVLVLVGGLGAQTKVVLRETERRLVIIPFLNASGESKWDYLSPGLAKLVSNKLESVPFVRGTPGVTFSASSRGPAQAGPLDALGEIPMPFTVKLRMEKDWSAFAEGHKPAELCGKLGAHFWAGGRFTKTESRVHVTARIYDCIRARSHEVTWSEEETVLYRNIDKPADELRAFVLGEKPIPLKVETPDPGAMVYLDSAYLGRTPLEVPVIKGRYTLRVEQDGRYPWSKTVEITPATNSFSVASDPHPGMAGLSVESDPPGADVYLDMQFLGKTPIKRVDLISGTHRLRLSLEKHIDRLVGVQIVDGQINELKLTLVPGDTLTFYKNPGEPIPGWTYADLSLYSAVSSLVFYLGWLDMQARAEQVQDSLKTYVPLVAVFQRFSAFQSGALPLAELAWQAHLVEENRLAVLKAHKRANDVGYVGIGMLGLSIFFLYQGISHDDKDAGELQSSSRVVPIFFVSAAQGNRGSAWGAGISFIF